VANGLAAAIAEAIGRVFESSEPTVR